jgi:microcystin-dependent protein
MSEPFIGEIIMFAGNFAPRGWAFCNGQLLSIAQNTALFSILGTTYGGNGQTTFALPDLRGRVPVHSGNSQGPGLSPYNLGQASGTETVTLLTNQMPMHTHAGAISAAQVDGTSAVPASTEVLAQTYDAGNQAQFNSYAPSTSTPLVPLAPNSVAIGVSGGSQPFGILQPYLAINFIIALEGIFPSRN